VNESSSSAPGRGALAEFKQAVSNLLEQVVGLAPDLGLGREFPRHELRVEDDGYRARLELPGTSREEVEVSIAGRSLTVSGERPRFEPPEGAHLLRRERPSGKFSLTIRLPAEVDPLGVVAKMREGVLDIRLPKPSPRGRSIEVESAEERPGGPAREAPEPEIPRPEGEARGREPEFGTREPDVGKPGPGRNRPVRMPWEEGPLAGEDEGEQERET
jgi:HSP20 family protein